MAASRGKQESLIKVVQENKHFPEVVASLFELIQGLIHKFGAVHPFIPIFTQYLELPEPVSKGLGAVVDASYMTSLTKYTGQCVGFDSNIDALSQELEF